MGPNDFRERLLALLMVALMLAAAFPAILATPGDGGGARPVGWSGSDDGHMWPMFARDASHTGEANSFERGLSNPGTKWERTQTTQGMSTVMGNFTGNVIEENSSFQWDGQLHCAVYSSQNQVHVVEGKAGEDVWLLNITGTFSAAPALGDVDNDGRTDIILATRTGVLYSYEPVIRWNGTRFTWWGNSTFQEQMWNTTGDTIGTVTSSSLVLDDLNSNGTDELLVGTSQGVFCLNARYGVEIWNRSVSGISISTPAVYKLGAQRNVVATSLNTTAFPSELHVYTLRGTTGSLIRKISMELTLDTGTILPIQPFMPSPVTADLDGENDGDELIIIQPYDGSTGRIIVFKDGNLAWNSIAYNKSLGGSGDLKRIALATPAVADLEGDGVLDVVVASWKPAILPISNGVYTNVSVFKGATGVRGWGANIDETVGPDAEWAVSSPVLMDADEDDILDVLLVQYNGRMNALSGKNGTLLWDLTTNGYPASLVTTSPAVGDLDLDGFPEVVVNSQAISFLLPDLEITTEDITLTDPNPEEGDQVGVDILVHNVGNDDARDVLVSLYDGDVLAGNATIDAIIAGSSYSARINHEFYGRVIHVLKAKVDPLEEIEELRTDNNEAEKVVTIVSRYGLAIECENNETIIAGGTTWHYFCEVTNLGQNANRIRITSSAAPQDWTVTIDPVSQLLGPAGGSSDTATVDVEVRTDHGAAAGEYPITITATSTNETRNNDSVVLTTVVLGDYGIYLSPGEARGSVAPGDAIVYKFNATNIGNDIDSFSVEAIEPNPDPDWGVNVFPTQINALDPEGSKEISLSVSAPFEATEGESYTVFLNVESLTEPTSYDESRTVTKVVIPDIAVLGIEYQLADGTVVDGTNQRLVADEDSTIVARVTNLRSNTDISNLRVRFSIDGIHHDVTVQDLPAEGVTRVPYVHSFKTLGTHSVQVTADPFEVISDADRSNNKASGTADVKSKTPIGPFEIIGTVYMSDEVTPVPSATVRVSVESTSYAFTVIADGLGRYSASLPDDRYSDGNQVVVNATDGRDYDEETVYAYSELGGTDLDLTLSEGIHYDVEWYVDPAEIDVDTGEAVMTNVTLIHTGTRDTVVDLSVQSDGWGPRLLFPNGTPAQSVFMMVGTVEDLVLAFDVPDNAQGATDMIFRLQAVPREDLGARDEFNLTANVIVDRRFEMDVVHSPSDPAHPGEERMHNITITNMGNVADVIDLSYDRKFITWDVTFDVDPVPLPAFDQVLIRMVLTVPETTVAGQYDIAVTGISQTNETVVANTHVIEVVEERNYDVSITATDGTASGKPGETIWWRLEVENLGNIRDTYQLSAFGLGEDYLYRFKVNDATVTEITLDPEGTVTVFFEVDIPTSFPDIPTHETQITVKVASKAEATAIDNTLLMMELEGILDLTIEVATSTNSPKLGQKVVFTVKVFNDGPDDASGVMLYAYFGEEPEKKNVGEVASKDTAEVLLEWFPLEEGSVQVRIIVNPEDVEGAIWEITYTNNDWVQPMRVSPTDEDKFYESGMFWLIIIIIVVTIIVAVAMLGGGKVEEAVDVVEVVEEDEESDEDDDDEELDDEEEYEDDEEKYEDEEDELEEEYEEEEGSPEPEPKEEREMSFPGGRM